jgi:hypothetical protein
MMDKCPKCGASFYKMHGDTPLTVFNCGTAVAPDGCYNEDRQCLYNQLAVKKARADAAEARVAELVDVLGKCRDSMPDDYARELIRLTLDKQTPSVDAMKLRIIDEYRNRMIDLMCERHEVDEETAAVLVRNEYRDRAKGEANV